MDEITLLTSLAMFLLLAAVCSIVFNKIKLPPLIGYLMAGIIVTNFWHTNETGEAVIEMLSNMGLVILMFCIGLEINLRKIRKQGLFAMEVALVQLPTMLLGGIIVGGLLGFDSIQSICLGAIISGSSTAVVLAVMGTHNLLNSDQKATLILVLIMEDIGQVIILSVITPMMAGSEMDAGALMVMILSIAAFMLVSIVVGLRLMPRVINWVADNVSSEVLVIFSVGLAFGMALLANYAGLSVAIGAFLMGMMIASSRKSKEIVHDIEPMKNIFMAMFFISVGMEIKLDTLIDNIPLILIIYALFAVLIITSVFIGFWLGNEKPRTGFISAIGLTVMGEFAFIIAKQALDYSVVDESFYTSVVGAALISMIILPLLAKNSGRIWDGMANHCPRPLLNMLHALDERKSSVYARIDDSSKRTRKEFESTVTRMYVFIVMCVVVEIAFMLLTPLAINWTADHLYGDEPMWRFIILMLNVVVLYVPTYYMMANLKAILGFSISDGYHGGMIDSSNKVATTSYKFVSTNTSLLSLMIAILVIIIIPNGLGLGEHFIVLGMALVILLLYNRVHLRKKFDREAYDAEEEDPSEIDTESFKKMIEERKRGVPAETEENISVSIDLKDT